MYACICHAVTSTEVAEVGARRCRDRGGRRRACGAGTGCGSCLDRICAIISSVDPAHGEPLLARVG